MTAEDTANRTAEERARVVIDDRLHQAGWVVQDGRRVNLSAGRGAAMREVVLKPAHGRVDYLLFVDSSACGVVEAKPEGKTLIGVEWQSGRYADGLPEEIPTAIEGGLPFLYESTGTETRFTNALDPDAASRAVFSFHRPETHAGWLDELRRHPVAPTLRHRLRALPPLGPSGLWPAQFRAIGNLERSLAASRPRALIQMATGSGKTFTAANVAYRLVKHAAARRILYLVDRANPRAPDAGGVPAVRDPRRLPQADRALQRPALASKDVDRPSRVVISTIQRMYSALRREELDPELDERSPAELATDAVPIAYSATARRAERGAGRVTDFVLNQHKGLGLPSGWAVAMLAEISEVRLGRQRSPKNHAGSRMRPYLRAENVTWNGFDLSDVKAMNFTELESTTYELHSGDVLVAEASGSASEVGKPAIWRGEIDGCCFQNTLIRIRTEKVSSTSATSCCQKLARAGSGTPPLGVGIHHIGARRLSEWPVPPLNEQRRIVGPDPAPHRRRGRVPPHLARRREAEHPERAAALGRAARVDPRARLPRRTLPARPDRRARRAPPRPPRGRASLGREARQVADVAKCTVSRAGQYFTPRPLIRAIVEVMRPEPGQTICDPACGTGGFLLAAYESIARTPHLTWLRDESLEDLENLPPPEVIAQEIVEELEAALAELAEVAAALGSRGRSTTTEHDARRVPGACSSAVRSPRLRGEQRTWVATSSWSRRSTTPRTSCVGGSAETSTRSR